MTGKEGSKKNCREKKERKREKKHFYSCSCWFGILLLLLLFSRLFSPRIASLRLFFPLSLFFSLIDFNEGYIEIPL